MSDGTTVEPTVEPTVDPAPGEGAPEGDTKDGGEALVKHYKLDEGDPPKEDPPKEDPPKEDPPKEDPPKEDPPEEGDPDDFDPTKAIIEFDDHMSESEAKEITDQMSKDGKDVKEIYQAILGKQILSREFSEGVQSKRTARLQEWKGEIEKDGELGGDNFGKSEASVERAIEKFGGREFRDFLEKEGILYQKSLYKALRQLGESLKDGSMPKVGGGADKSEVEDLIRHYKL